MATTKLSAQIENHRYREMQFLPLELGRRRRVVGVFDGIHGGTVEGTIAAGAVNADIADRTIVVVETHSRRAGSTGQDCLTRINLGRIHCSMELLIEISP